MRCKVAARHLTPLEGQGDGMTRVLLALVMTALVGAALVGCKAEVEKTSSNIGAAR